MRTGFRVAATTIGELTQLLTPYRDTVLQLARQRAVRFVALRAATILDQRTLGIVLDDERPLPASGSPLWAASEELDDRQREARAFGLRDPEAELEVRVVCRYDPVLKAVLGFVLADDSGAAYRALLHLPGVAEYRYTDGCVDVPEGVSKRDWSARRKAWTWFLGEAAPQAIEFSILDPYLRTSLDEVVPAIPELDVRSGFFARQVLFNDWCGARTAQGLDADNVNGSKRWLLQNLFSEALGASTDMKARLFDLTSEIESKLVPPEDLREALTKWPD